MICKYCFTSDGNLTYPCECKNPVHLKCLQDWIKYKKYKHITCEICLQNYSFYYLFLINFKTITADVLGYLIVLMFIYFMIKNNDYTYYDYDCLKIKPYDFL